MGAFDEVRAALTGEFRDRYGENAHPEALATLLDAMIDYVATISTGDREEADSRVSSISLSSSDGSKGSAAPLLSYRRLSHHDGPLSWLVPHDCHITIEICWPHPDESDKDLCLEIELPWFCPDVRLPPIILD